MRGAALRAATHACPQHACVCRDANLPDKEQEVRRRADLVRVLVASVGTLAWSVAKAQSAASDRVGGAAVLGRAFSHLAVFEAAAAHPGDAEDAEKFGGGCTAACNGMRDGLAAAGTSTKVRWRLCRHSRRSRR
jgi:hypothetical protein